METGRYIEAIEIFKKICERNPPEDESDKLDSDSQALSPESYELDSYSYESETRDNTCMLKLAKCYYKANEMNKAKQWA